MIENACHMCEVAFYEHRQLAQHVNYVHSSNWNGVTSDGVEPLPPRQLRHEKPVYVIEEEPG